MVIEHAGQFNFESFITGNIHCCEFLYHTESPEYKNTWRVGSYFGNCRQILRNFRKIVTTTLYISSSIFEMMDSQYWNEPQTHKGNMGFEFNKLWYFFYTVYRWTFMVKSRRKPLFSNVLGQKCTWSTSEIVCVAVHRVWYIRIFL